MKTKILFALLFAFACFMSLAQESYVVDYDYIQNDLRYYKIGADKKTKEIKKTEIKHLKLNKNTPLVFKIKNVNPLALKYSIEKNESEVHNSEGYGIGNLLSSFSGVADNVEFKNISSDFLSQMDSISSRSSTTFNQYVTDVEIFKQAKNVKKIAFNIASSTNKDKNQILKEIRNLLKANPEIGKNGSDNNKLSIGLLKLVEELESHKSNIENFDLLSIKNPEDTSRSNPSSTLDMENLYENKSKIIKAYDQAIGDIDIIRTIYEKVENADFDTTVDYIIEKDVTNFNLKFNRSGLLNLEEDVSQLIRLRKINVEGFGGWKINTSVALTFTSFGKNSKDYYINEQKEVGANDNNFFTPSIATMINFYPFRSKNFNYGGSFGLSVPISDENIGVNYLLGLSGFIGDKNRISLTGGIMYGPVNELKDGATIGSNTTVTDANDLTRKVYDLGYFIGISFSLFNLNNRF